MAVEVKLPEFRASYVNVDRSKTVTNDDGSTKEIFSVMALFAIGADIKVAKDAALQAAKDKWGADKAMAVIKHPKFKSPFKEQSSLVDDDGTQKPGTVAGGVFINLNHQLKPLVLGPNAKPIADPRDFYSGCHAVAKCEVYAWEHPKGGRGITFGLLGIQKVRDGERLGGGGLRADPSDFEAVAGAENAGGVFDDDMPF